MSRTPGLGSLFERLEADAPPRRLQSRQALAAERIGAIKRHLAWILNARRGCSQSSPGLGLPELNDAAAGSGDMRARVCADIRDLIATYEPRVRAVHIQPVEHRDRAHELHFRVRCAVPLNNVEEQVEIDLIATRAGRWVTST
ncbi:type VI secretion system baseplate subunit TssE [Burkholderia contaminans]|uniref:type VI secretion system baseplate subunit TssE n=1 Tax=Burkholderia contaminans TaxID=488447 RepID=UPI001CF496E3|nr:type VI secretion system baseplate subunit TssE [Burkholderia contaminans]MCA7918757.1 type VI secretion system baseplate subunit TssE [Burkholderia contaminans]UUX35754.1 type VI secretion system baseplate subunit TssE [Burkholderia contaminans]